MSNREEIDQKIYNCEINSTSLNMSIIFSFLAIIMKFYGIYVYSGKVTISKTVDRKSTRLNSSHLEQSRMPSSA